MPLFVAYAAYAAHYLFAASHYFSPVAAVVAAMMRYATYAIAMADSCRLSPHAAAAAVAIDDEYSRRDTSGVAGYFHTLITSVAAITIISPCHAACRCNQDKATPPEYCMSHCRHTYFSLRRLPMITRHAATMNA